MKKSKYIKLKRAKSIRIHGIDMTGTHRIRRIVKPTREVRIKPSQAEDCV